MYIGLCIYKNMLPFKEVAVLDRNSGYWGVPPEQLMENAGRSLARQIEKRFPDEEISFICGTGNNGGDGYVAARYLWGWRDGRGVKVYLLKGRENVRSDISKKNLDRLECPVEEDICWEDVSGTVIVDGLLGTGISGRIREPYRTAIEKINSVGSHVVSIDLPSGLGADMKVEPELTVTFHAVKEGMNEEKCGEIVVVDIGIPEEAGEYTGPGEMLLYPKPREDSHKWDNGAALVVGGGPYTGAPALCGKAAYRIGADLVFLAVPGQIYDVVAGYSPSFIVEGLDGKILKPKHVEKVVELSERCDALVIGPGLGEAGETKKAVVDILSQVDIPAVVDADGLKAVKGNESKIETETVITPHRGEFKMLTGAEGDLEKAVDVYAEECGFTVLLKGKVDYLSDGVRRKKNDFGTPAMTVGGSGDTLAGAVGGLMAKGMDPFNAARLGAYITCRAGGEAFEEKSWGLMPEDISECFSKVLIN